MYPGMAVGFRAVGQQRIMGAVIAPACEATVWRGCCRITVHPFAYTAGKRLGLRFRTRQATVELDNPGALVEIDLPVVGRPTVVTGTQQGNNPSLVSGEGVENGFRRW